jgi:hypothetical protein
MTQKVPILIVSVGATCLFFINFCALVFGCGCHPLWAGADASCNIHLAGTHHCPWCAHTPSFAFAAMVLPQALISFGSMRVAWWKRLALALAAFPVFGGIAAVIYGLASGYWTR